MARNRRRGADGALDRRATDKVLGAHAVMWRRMENEGKMQALGGGAFGRLVRGWPGLNLKRSGVNDVCGDFAMRDT